MKNKTDLQKHWPKDSLKRTLVRDFPGSKSLQDALKKTIELKNQTAAQTTKDETYEAVRQIIKEIELLLETVSFESIAIHKRESLALLPLTSLGEAEVWRDAWKKVVQEAVGENFGSGGGIRNPGSA